MTWRHDTGRLEAVPADVLERCCWTADACDELGVRWNGTRAIIATPGGRLAYWPWPGEPADERPKMDGEPGSTRRLWPEPETYGPTTGRLWIVEGEADVIAAIGLGLAAVAIPGSEGVRRIVDEPARFAGLDVAILFDCDAAGRRAAQKAAAALDGVAASVRVVDLAPDDDDGYDLRDHLRDQPGADGLDVLRGLADHAPAWAPPAELAAPSTWQPSDLVAAGEHPPDPPELLHLFARGRRHWLTGENESGKTWVAVALLADRAAAGENVWWIDFENGPAIALERLRMLGLDDETITSRVRYANHPDGAITSADVDAIAADAPAVVVIDACASMLGANGWNPNDETDVDKLDRGVLVPLRNAGACVVVIDHPVKDPDQRGRYAKGSGRKIDAADAAFNVRSVDKMGRDRAGRSVIRCDKDRSGYLRSGEDVATFALDTTGDDVAWSLAPIASDGEARPWRPTALMERVSDYLARLGDAAGRNEIRTAITANRDYVRKAIDALIGEGYAVGEDGPRGAKLVRLERPYRQADDPLSDRYEPPTAPTAPDCAPTAPRAQSVDCAHRAPTPKGEGAVDGRTQTSHCARPDPDRLDGLDNDDAPWWQDR